MGNFNHPPASLMFRILYLFGIFLAPAFYMRDKPAQHYSFQSRLPGIPFIQAQMVGAFEYIGAFNNYGIQHRLKLGNIMPVRPGYHN
jgi:hypothetical protein